MSKKFKTVWFRSGLQKKEPKKGIFTEFFTDPYSKRMVDMDEFSRSLEDHCNQLDQEGYDVVNIIPISMGQSEPSVGSGADTSFSITRGAVILGKLRENDEA